MLFATNQKYNLEQSEMRRHSIVLGNRGSRGTFDSVERRLSTSGLIASNNRVNHFVRLIYFLNAAIVLIGLGYITQMQQNGGYRTKSIRVLFGEEIWENANVQLENGSVEQRLLIYPYFNGIYNGKTCTRIMLIMFILDMCLTSNSRRGWYLGWLSQIC